MSSRKRKEKSRVIQTEKIGQPKLLFMPDGKANQSKILFKNFFEGKIKANNSAVNRAASTTKNENLSKHSDVPADLKEQVFPDQDLTSKKRDNVDSWSQLTNQRR